MRESTKLKLRMIRRIIKSDGCVLVTKCGNKFHYSFAGRSDTIARLFKRLQTFVPKWYAQIKPKHETH